MVRKTYNHPCACGCGETFRTNLPQGTYYLRGCARRMETEAALRRIVAVCETIPEVPRATVARAKLGLSEGIEA